MASPSPSKQTRRDTRRHRKQRETRHDSVEKTAPGSARHKNLLKSAALIALTLLAYLPALRAGYIWDDDAYVQNNRALRTLSGLFAIWFNPSSQQYPVDSQYYPLTYTTFWIEYHLWGLRPLGYHLVNILLHGLNALLLERVLRRLGLRFSWAAAALFALHPIQVETVAWVTERKNLTAGLCALASTLAYLRFAGIGSRHDSESPPNNSTSPTPASRRSWGLYAISLILFGCALVGKTVAAMLAPTLLFLVWWKRGWEARRHLAAIVPYFLLGAALGLFSAYKEAHSVGARGEEWDLSFPGRVILAGRVLAFYAAKLVWPANLNFNYARWTINPDALWQHLFPLAAVALFVLLAALAWRGRIGRGPLAAGLIYAVNLFPVLGFLNVFPMRYSFVADHFQYFAGVALITGGAEWLFTRAARLEAKVPRLTPVLLASLLAVLGLLTWRQTLHYKDPETLWRNTLRRNPTSWLAHSNLGMILLNQQKVQEALGHFLQAKQVAPRVGQVRGNLGSALIALQRKDEAFTEFQEAVRLDPNDARSRANLANILSDRGDWDGAERHYRESLRIDPYNEVTHFNFAELLAFRRRIPEARKHYEEALRLHPGWSVVEQTLKNLPAK